MEPLDAETQEQCKQIITITIPVTEALGLLGTIQLALRHPQFAQKPTAQWAKRFGESLSEEITSKAPKLKFLCDAGWHKKFDRP